ncbi:iron-containing alcohol dehydrogenase [candidate division KSB1 bacterium]|nr:iron-containing alcohol dehydrogenase [candidate division KSB1 bacterium]
MQSFTFYNTTKIVFGKGQISELSNLISKDQKIMMIAGGGSINKNGVYDQVMSALEGYKVIEFWGLQPNPEYEKCMEAVQLAKEEKVDFLLSVGGGSVLDATKFIAAALHYEGDDPWAFLDSGEEIKSMMPVGCILTLPATGSESNGNAVISRSERNQKLAFSNPKAMPVFSILDPETTLTLDDRQTANGIVDAFIHVMEQYMTYDVNTPLQDRQAEAILKTLIEQAPKVKANPNDYNTRANIMWCATQALNTLIGSGVVQDWSTHMIGHELTVLHGLDHAQTLAIVLPALLKHQRKQKGGKLVQFGRRVWDIQDTGEDSVIQKAIEKMAGFFEEAGNPTQLSAYDIKVDDCLIAAKRLFEREGKIGERGDIGQAEIEAILRLAE